MTNKYDETFKEMIIQKYRNGEKVSVLSKDYQISRAVIYQWNQKIGKNLPEDHDEVVDYEKEYRKALKKLDEAGGEIEALKKCIAIFSKK